MHVYLHVSHTQTNTHRCEQPSIPAQIRKYPLNVNYAGPGTVPGTVPDAGGTIKGGAEKKGLPRGQR